MEDQNELRQHIRAIQNLMLVFFLLMAVTAGGVILLLYFPDTFSFKTEESTTDYVEIPEAEDDFDKIENGIHVRTGLVEAEGLMEVVNNCTNCHSALLVTQNRMNEERWIATIRWMQETQNLWDLGNNEQIIVNYLVTNYPPVKKGRRANLQNIEWYELED